MLKEMNIHQVAVHQKIWCNCGPDNIVNLSNCMVLWLLNVNWASKKRF